MEGKIKNRDGCFLPGCNTGGKSLHFLYETAPGRVFLKLLTRRFVSKLAGAYMNSRISKLNIKNAIKCSGIDLSEYEITDYKRFSCYNDFFTRQIKKEKRPLALESDIFISPCDSKLTVYTIDEDSCFHIKGSVYTINDLLGGNKALADQYKGGYCLIFRLTVDNYHRYCYIDNGKKGENIFIPGVLHTVNPISLGRYNIYKRNCREYTVLHTENFDDVVQIEVGAMMVGRIKNHHGVYSFKKGEEKGMFEFGGSTIVLLVKKDILTIDSDILANSAENIETAVKMGERIAVRNGAAAENN